MGLPQGLESIPISGVNISTSVQDSEGTKPDGSWEKTKVITKRVEPVGEITLATPGDEVNEFLKPAEISQALSVPEVPYHVQPTSIIKGGIQVKTDVQVNEKKLDDDSTLKKKITIAQYSQPLTYIA